ncbi:MAG: choice-of-anchor B domain-containing protein [Ulvibacter sp.]|jgi:choice-of-anchor B domain-containing protein
MKSVLLPLLLLLSGPFVFSQSSITTSSNMSLLSNWAPDSVPQYNDIWGYMDCYGNEFALLGSKFKIHFLDVTDPTNPVEVANFAGGEGTTWRDIKTYRNRAYAISDNTSEGLMIFDMSNLPQTVSKTYHANSHFENAHNLFIDEPNGRMYVAGSEVGNLLIFDLSVNPDAPVLVENLSLEGGYVHDLYVRDHLAYCSHLSSGMYIYDCRTPSEIEILGSVTDYQGTVFNHSNWLSEDGNTLIFCDETHGAPVKIADVSDPSDIKVPADQMFSSTLLAPTATNSIAHNPLIRGGYAFISYYHDGVQVYDMNNPDSIYQVAYFDTNTENTDYGGYLGCWGVYPFLSSGTIIASDINKGLFVLSLDAISLEPNLDDIIPDATISMTNGPLVCEGDSAILSLPFEAKLSYIWTKDDEVLQTDGNSLTIMTPGDYQLEVNNGICNSFSISYTIEFKESPDLTTMTGDAVNLCLGDNYIITAPTGMDAYLWMQDGNVLSNASHLIQVVESGVYTLLAYKDGCPSFSAPYHVNVNEVPATTISSVQEAICVGSEIQLQTGAGAENYNWFKDGELVANTTEPFFSTEEEGTYTVTLSILDCSETSDDFILEFSALPINEFLLSGSSTICEGESVTLSANENAASWQWLLDDELYSTNAIIEATDNGFYELTITNDAGCTATSQQFVNLSIVNPPTVILQNDVLTASSEEFYQWYLNDQIIEGATGQTYTPTQNGSYTLVVTNNIGCTAGSAPFQLTTVSIEIPESLQDVRFYPNPVSELLQIELTNYSLEVLHLEIFNASGKRLQKLNINSGMNSSTNLNMGHLSTGLYFVKLTNADGSLVQKILKE